MNKTVVVLCLSALALVAAMKFPGLRHAPAPLAASAVQPVAPVVPSTDIAAAKPISRREQMARLVAETAAETADRTARRVLTEKSEIQQTALR